MRDGIEAHVFERTLREQHAVVDGRHIRLLGSELLSGRQKRRVKAASGLAEGLLRPCLKALVGAVVARLKARVKRVV